MVTTTDLLQTRIDNLKAEHRKLYGDSGSLRVYKAPGRVNIIGEHTDYNGGYVLPAAIDISILATATKRTDRQIHCKSKNFPDIVVADLDNLAFSEKQGWANFPLSCAWILQKHGIKLPGVNITFQGDVPLGSGLSSSAAIEVLMMTVLLDLADTTLEGTLLPVYCREAENGFIGVKSGIMDQFIITFGKENHAIFLNCDKLEYQAIPFCNADETAIIVGNTKVKRELAKSAYNQRVEECAEGVRLLKELTGKHDIKSLSDITKKEFDACKMKLPGLISRRCDHVISENQRVLDTVDALKSGNLPELGKLLLASHASLRDLYEVSCAELDAMVESFMESSAVFGSRMTGAGFGGSAIALVKADSKEEVIEHAARRYKEKTGIDGEFYVCQISEGAGRLE